MELLCLSALIVIGFPGFARFLFKVIGGIVIITMLMAMGWPAIIAWLVVVIAVIVIRVRKMQAVTPIRMGSAGPASHLRICPQQETPSDLDADPLEALLRSRRLAGTGVQERGGDRR